MTIFDNSKVSFVLEEELVEPANIKILTEKLYSSFNGIGTVKSIEYTGKREIGQDVGVQTAMERRSAARVAKWRGRRDTSDAHHQLRALRKLELMEEIKARVANLTTRISTHPDPNWGRSEKQPI